MFSKIKMAGLGLVLVAGLALALPQSARADSFTLSGCSACAGNTYTMSYLSLGGNSYRIDLTIDASGFTSGPAYLMAVAPNITGWTNLNLTSAPGLLSDWSTQPGGLNAKGCKSTMGGTPFFCSWTTDQGTFNATGSSTPLNFSWTLDDAALPTDTDGAHLQVYFVASGDSYGDTQVGGLLSTDMTLKPESTVPEPATLLLLGSGLLGLGWFVRRHA